MPTKLNKDLNFAVLIDGDNIPSKYTKEMLQEIAKFGTPSIKRIYGDWTNPYLTKWKNILLENAIQPIQQYGYTQGKNATDSAMIIDAMDILYTGKTDGFCIASSDSDFTRLATRLRESGQYVIGIGEKKTPEPFIVACDKFIYLEILKADDTEDEKAKSSTKKRKTIQSITPKFVNIIRQSIYACADDDGWAFLGDVGSLINKKHPDFDPRNFGFYKLTPLMESIGSVEVEERQAPNSRSKHIYVKNLQRTKTKKKESNSK